MKTLGSRCSHVGLVLYEKRCLCFCQASVENPATIFGARIELRDETLGKFCDGAAGGAHRSADSFRGDKTKNAASDASHKGPQHNLKRNLTPNSSAISTTATD